LKRMSLRTKLRNSEKEILNREINIITNIFDIGTEAGQQVLKQGLKNLLN